MPQNHLDHIKKAGIFIDVRVRRMCLQDVLLEGLKCMPDLRKLKDLLIDTCEEKLQGVERGRMGVQIHLHLWLHLLDVQLFHKRQPQRAFGGKVLKHGATTRFGLLRNRIHRRLLVADCPKQLKGNLLDTLDHPLLIAFT